MKGKGYTSRNMAGKGRGRPLPAASAQQPSTKADFFSAADKRQQGWNGEAELTLHGLGDDMVGFSDKFIRGLSEDRIRDYASKILIKANADSSIEQIINLFILGFQTRWARGGKKEKLVVYKLLKLLATKYPEAVKTCLGVMPEYGYWKDPLLFLAEFKTALAGARDPVWTKKYYDELLEHVANLFAEQLMKDKKALEKYQELRRNEEANKARALGGAGICNLVESFAPIDWKRSDIKCEVSRAGMWAPSIHKAADKALRRENTLVDGKVQYIGIADLIARLLFPEIKKKPEREKAYRLFLKELREALDVPEIKMCAHKWAEIRFAGFCKVTSLCLKRNRAAFFNEKVNKGPHPGTAEAETGNRHPNNTDRVECRKHALAAVRKGQAAGKETDLPELTALAMR
jgi:hypothetical protein